eukprot:7543268-Pyramimonas_sp.AAC.1
MAPVFDMRASAMAYRKLNLRQGRDALDSMANIEIRLRESGWLTFVDQKDPPSLKSRSQDETAVVEMGDPELGNELNG